MTKKKFAFFTILITLMLVLLPSMVFARHFYERPPTHQREPEHQHEPPTIYTPQPRDDLASLYLEIMWPLLDGLPGGANGHTILPDSTVPARAHIYDVNGRRIPRGQMPPIRFEMTEGIARRDAVRQNVPGSPDATITIHRYETIRYVEITATATVCNCGCEDLACDCGEHFELTDSRRIFVAPYLYVTRYISGLLPDCLAPVSTIDEAVQAVYAALGRATQAQLSSGWLELYADIAIGQAASINVGSEIEISMDAVAEAAEIAHHALEAIEAMLEENDYQLQRDLRPTVTFASYADDISINIDPSANDANIVQFTVQTPEFFVTIPEAFVESEARTSPITVNMSTNDEIYEVSFSRPVTQPVRIAIPCEESSDYMAIQRQGTDAFVGGLRNPVTGLREANVTASDTHILVENRVNFTDIQHLSLEAQRAIRVLAAHGKVSGVGDNRFNPDAAINRAEIAALVTNMLGLRSQNVSSNFRDVQRADWFFAAAGNAYRHGLMQGTGNNMFSPRVVLPRDQLTALAARVLRTQMGYRTPANPEGHLMRFVDRDDFANWSIADLALAARENLVIRRADNRFMPREPMTRGDAALILYRLYNRLW